MSSKQQGIYLPEGLPGTRLLETDELLEGLSFEACLDRYGGLKVVEG